MHFKIQFLAQRYLSYFILETFLGAFLVLAKVLFAKTVAASAASEATTLPQEPQRKGKLQTIFSCGKILHYLLFHRSSLVQMGLYTIPKVQFLSKKIDFQEGIEKLRIFLEFQ